MKLPSTDPFVLFLRHGERAPLPPDDPYADVDLTPSGYAAVSRLAESLVGRLRWTAASPFLRCRVTARGLGPEPEDDTRLGRHGPWIADPVAAGREFAARGTEGVVRAQVAGVGLSGIRQPSEAVPLLLSCGLDRAGRGSGACVSHDAVLMPAMAWLFGADAADDWLAPLGGFVVEVRSTGPVAVWRDRERPC
jgi:broad specificity phosphatase PhoE